MNPRLTGFGGAFQGRRVLVTGHTGFKGSWLCEWLLGLGAQVTGFSQPPETDPALFNQLGLASRMDHVLGDIRGEAAVARVVSETRPDFVFHLAAQPLVRRSYREPIATWQTNVMGTLHVLEALRRLDQPCAAVLITTDKCYENREWVYGYRENDALGGRDPYSSSKAAAEIAIHAWRHSYFPAGDGPVRIASARAGNVIGGGDWSEDRIVPDCIRALRRGQPVKMRNPWATRPWQHVLEPLSGYLWLAACLLHPGWVQQTPETLCGPFNFGPGPDANRSVAELVQEIMKYCEGSFVDAGDPNAPHEAGRLQLNTDRAHALLRWSPVWRFQQVVLETAKWYIDTQDILDPVPIHDRVMDQMETYTANAVAAGVPWAAGRFDGGGGA
ncbi:MAG: CDP-glucose 4,6-dehydratase [Verrucomicrobiales bacterium]|nr:CDP-glucose 4,6-dehydratase [Verrucomicrobiales bacterium]